MESNEPRINERLTCFYSQGRRKNLIETGEVGHWLEEPRKDREASGWRVTGNAGNRVRNELLPK